MKVVKKILPFVGIAIFAVLVGRIGVEKIWGSLRQAKTHFLIVAFLLNIPAVILQGVKWKVVLRRLKIKIGFFEVLKLYFLGYFYAAMTPARAGIIMKGYYLKEKTRESLTKCSLSVMIDWVFGMFVSYLVALLGVVFLLGAVVGEGAARIVLVGVLVLMILIVFLLFGKGKRFLDFGLSFLPFEGMRKRISGILERMDEEKFGVGDFWLIFLANVAFYAMALIRAYFLALSAGVGVSFWVLAAAVSLVLTFAFVPVTVSGIGISEIGLVFLLGQFGAEASAVITYSLLGYLMVIIPQAVAGWIASLSYIKKPDAAD